MATSLSPVGIVWAILSLLATIVVCISYLLPYWLLGAHHHIIQDESKTSFGTIQNILGTNEISFGIFRRCGYVVRLSARESTFDWLTGDQSASRELSEFVIECGRYRSLTDIPSLWWRCSTIAMGVGICLSVLVMFAGLLCCCVGDALSHKMAAFASLVQITAACSIVAGCLLYALGWDNAEVRLVCGMTADMFNSGSCRIGWCLWTTVSAGATLFMCSVLACYAARRKGGYQRTPVRV